MTSDFVPLAIKKSIKASVFVRAGTVQETIRIFYHRKTYQKFKFRTCIRQKQPKMSSYNPRIHDYNSKCFTNYFFQSHRFKSTYRQTIGHAIYGSCLEIAKKQFRLRPKKYWHKEKLLDHKNRPQQFMHGKRASWPRKNEITSSILRFCELIRA